MLSLKNLSVNIDGKKVVNSVDLLLKPGSIHALSGPNGSGKTSLSLALAGHPDYLLSSSSSIELDGTSLVDLAPYQRALKGLCLAFQYPVSIPGVSIQNFLKIAFDTLHPQSKQYPSVLSFREDLYQLASSVGLTKPMLSRSLNEGFSGGEKKRLELLQLLVLKPKYAILDETDSGLDIDSIKLIAKVITALVKDHQTGVLIITHYQKLLQELKPDKIHVMISSKLVKTGGLEILSQLEKSGYSQFTK